MKFPYYSGNIRLTKVLGHVSIEQFIRVHENPKLGTIEIINLIKKAEEENDFKLKRKLKHQLFSFTPSVFIHKNQKRKYENIIYYTGLMQLDFDKIPDLKVAIEIKEYVFNQPETICSYLSPSQKGVKSIILTKQPEDKEHYKAIHKAVSSKYESLSYMDESTKNAMLPLFLSIDYDILSRNYNECKAFTDEDWSKPNYVELNNEPPHQTSFNGDYYYDKTLRILRDKINNINDNGHPQVRNAALILGSRVGAGYIDLITAQNEIENLIRNNNYLKKGTSGYISTALWGISEGYKNPKYYD